MWENRVLMPLSKQADHLTGPINNHGKQAGDVTAKHAYVKGFELSDGGIPSPKRHLAVPFTTEPDACFDKHRIGHASDTTEVMWARDRLESKHSQDRCTEDGTIRTRIN